MLIILLALAKTFYAFGQKLGRDFLSFLDKDLTKRKKKGGESSTVLSGLSDRSQLYTCERSQIHLLKIATVWICIHVLVHAT